MLFFAINGDGVAHELRRAFAVLVQIGLKAAIADIHLSQTGQDLIGAGVHIVGDKILPDFYLGLYFRRDPQCLRPCPEAGGSERSLVCDVGPSRKINQKNG